MSFPRRLRVMRSSGLVLQLGTAGVFYACVSSSLQRAFVSGMRSRAACTGEIRVLNGCTLTSLARPSPNTTTLWHTPVPRPLGGPRLRRCPREKKRYYPSKATGAAMGAELRASHGIHEFQSPEELNPLPWLARMHSHAPKLIVPDEVRREF